MMKNNEVDTKQKNTYSAKYLQKIGELYNTLTSVSDKNKIYKALKDLALTRENQEKLYFKSLLFPEKYRGVRIPSRFPTPSIGFTSDDSIIITTNALGNFQLQWTPQSLYSTSAASKEVYLNVDTTLTGGSTSSVYTSANVLVNSYFAELSAFRIVSACLIIQYIGSFQDTKGLIGGALDVNSAGDTQNTQFSIFSNIDDKIYSQRVSPDKGLKLHFFPVDYSNLNYLKPNTTPSANYLPTHLRFHVYGQGLPANQACIRIDFVKNIEAIPGANVQELLATGFEMDRTDEGDAFLKASRIMSANNLSVNTLEESKMLEKILEKPGDSYKKEIEEADIQMNDDNKTVKLNNVVRNMALPQKEVSSDLVFKNPKEIRIN